MSKAINRLEKILECIGDIDFILNNNTLKVTQAIENKIFKAAIRMNIIRIAEQFSKLKDENEFKVLENFRNEDLKGISAVRNFIAHDYDSTNDIIIEEVIRYNLPILKETSDYAIKNLLSLQENNFNNPILILSNQIKEINPGYKLLSIDEFNSKLSQKLVDKEELENRYMNFLKLELNSISLNSKDKNNDEDPDNSPNI